MGKLESESQQIPQVIVNNYPPQQPSQELKRPPATKPFNISFPSISQDWAVAFFAVILLVSGFESNFLRLTKNSFIGQFFTDSTLVSKTAAKATNKPQEKVTSQEKVFPMAGWTAEKARTRITGWVGDCRPLGSCKRRHAGIDWAIKGAVVASLGGEVIELKPGSKVGGVIGIKSTYQGKTYILRYVHLDRKPLHRFKRGKNDPPKYVKTGERLSDINTTFPGSSGAHLHLEIYTVIDGVPILMRNPQDFWN